MGEEQDVGEEKSAGKEWGTDEGKEWGTDEERGVGEEWGRSGARERMTVPSARPLYLIAILTPDADFVKPIEFCPMREPRPHLPYF